MGQTRPSLGSNVVRNAPIGLQMAQAISRNQGRTIPFPSARPADFDEIQSEFTRFWRVFVLGNFHGKVFFASDREPSQNSEIIFTRGLIANQKLFEVTNTRVLFGAEIAVP